MALGTAAWLRTMAACSHSSPQEPAAAAVGAGHRLASLVCLGHPAVAMAAPAAGPAAMRAENKRSFLAVLLLLLLLLQVAAAWR